MATLVLSPRLTVDSVAVGKAASRLGWSIARLARWRDAEALPPSDLVVYGEQMFVEYVAATHDLALLEPPFDFLASLRWEHRKRSVEFMTLGRARMQPTAAFIKPADDKCFSARVYASGAELPGLGILPDETPVLVVEPVEWTVEYRCFVLDREVVTLSPYLRGGDLAQDEFGAWPALPSEVAEATASAARVLGDSTVNVPPAFVLDIGILRRRGWAVIEANPAWGAGVYGCDPVQVLSVVARSCVPLEHLDESDTRWAMNLLR